MSASSVASVQSPRPTLTASEQIARFAASFDAARVGASLQRTCARSFADTFAVGVAGRNEAAALAALRYVECTGSFDTSGDASHAGRASLWGQSVFASVETAAFYNGIAAHVLDYDDVTVPLRGHPSVVLWPALLALAEAAQLPGERLAAAYVVGFEVICKLARVLAVAQYDKGWHCTASIGVLGATVASAWLTGLSETQTVHALGLAVAQAAGSRDNVGTEAKSFQAGQASAAAVRATLLAQAGLRASADALDGPHGYTALYGERQDLGPSLRELGGEVLELERSGLDIKQYPMCYATHRTLDALLALRHEHGLTLSEVRHVSIRTSRGALVPLTRHRPASGLEGKFSIEYACAAALADGHVRLTSFTDAAVNRPALQAFFPHVVAAEADLPLVPRVADVIVTLHDGRVLRRRVEMLHGSSQDPLSDAELQAKLADCLAWSQSPVSAAHLVEVARRMNTLAVHDLLAQLR
ncbi:MmgE/PrpD family protein [Paraburkholderia sp. BCC1886]|uniref:MmgE/PrpD family protein n=1 Tax=Paraburkholderia sp. BCC1886 TaxID=2562670 RepID=UPI0011831C94|nr:MmgE/PrpD family protein [Paraburkholderia sp. BCC1886]